jgi:hypothetical protein
MASLTTGGSGSNRTLLAKSSALQNQSLGSRNLRNEQGQRNAASELCTAKQVELFHTF